MSNLFDINVNHLRLIQALEDRIEAIDFDTEELEDAAEDELSALNDNLDEAKEKIKSYYYYITQKKGEIELINDEINRLKLKQQSKENLIKRLSKNVDEALRIFGEKSKAGGYKLTCDTLNVWNVFTKPVVLDEDFENPNYGKYDISGKVDEELKDTIQNTFGNTFAVKFNPDKKAIKEALLAGKELKGASINYDTTYVRFK